MSESGAKMTAADVRTALRAYYPAPRCAVVFEVAQGTGQMARRHLDALAMDLWPSHGLRLHGIEIKVDRGDFRRELADPSKAEEIARYTDFFWIAAPQGLLAAAEMPPAWGLLAVGAGGRVKVEKQAEVTPAQELNRAFLAALLRAAARPLTGDEVEAILRKRTEEITEQHRKSYADAIEREVARRSKRDDADAKAWRELVVALGMTPSEYHDREALVAAAAVVFKAGVTATYSGIAELRRSLEGAVKKIDQAMATLGTTQPPVTS